MKAFNALLVILAALFAGCAAAQSAGFANLAEIDRLVAQFSGLPPGAIPPTDRRLRLRACDAPLALAWHNTRRDTVRVECPRPGGWKLFVALGSAAREVIPHETPLVRKGEPVIIHIEGSGFSIATSGTALDNGGAADQVRVRPDGTKASLNGRVEAAGTVTVGSP